MPYVESREFIDQIWWEACWQCSTALITDGTVRYRFIVRPLPFEMEDYGL